MRKWILLFATAFTLTTTYAKPDPSKPFYVQTWETKNQVPVYFIRRPDLKFADLSVLYNAGSAHDRTMPGLANATSLMVMSGTGEKSASDIGKAFEIKGAEFTNEVDRDATRLRLRTPIEKNLLDANVGLFADIISKPSLKASELPRIKKEIATTIRLQKDEPSEYALEKFYQTVYKDHPYANNPLGTDENLQAITLENIKAFHHKFYNSNNAKIAIVGDLTIDQAKQLADRIAMLMPKGLKAKPIPKAPGLESAITKSFTVPTSQTTVIIGRDGITRRYKKIMALRLANHILGVLPMDSILFNKVRKEHGLVYSIGSQLLPYKSGGLFFVILQTRNAERDNAARLTKEQIDNFATQPLDDKRFLAAKKQLIDTLPLSLYSNQSMLMNLENIAIYNQPLDYLQAYPDMINKLSKRDVQNAFKELDQHGYLATVMVGGEVE